MDEAPKTLSELSAPMLHGQKNREREECLREVPDRNNEEAASIVSTTPSENKYKVQHTC